MRHGSVADVILIRVKDPTWYFDKVNSAAAL